MNNNSYLTTAGVFSAPAKYDKLKGGLHMPQMCVKVENKSVFVDQKITLTTHINKGKQYPYASTKRRPEN